MIKQRIYRYISYFFIAIGSIGLGWLVGSLLAEIVWFFIKPLF